MKTYFISVGAFVLRSLSASPVSQTVVYESIACLFVSFGVRQRVYLAQRRILPFILRDFQHGFAYIVHEWYTRALYLPNRHLLSNDV